MATTNSRPRGDGAKASLEGASVLNAQDTTKRRRTVKPKRPAPFTRDGGPWSQRGTDSKVATKRAKKALQSLTAAASPKEPFFTFMTQALCPLDLGHEWEQRPSPTMEVSSCTNGTPVIPFRGKVTISVIRQAFMVAERQLLTMAVRGDLIRQLVFDFRDCSFEVDCWEVLAVEECFEYLKNAAVVIRVSELPDRALDDYGWEAAQSGGRLRHVLVEEEEGENFVSNFGLHHVTLGGSF